SSSESAERGQARASPLVRPRVIHPRLRRFPADHAVPTHLLIQRNDARRRAGPLTDRVLTLLRLAPPDLDKPLHLRQCAYDRLDAIRGCRVAVAVGFRSMEQLFLDLVQHLADG